MNPFPPFLLGAALLFWGWQTHLWIFAIPTALLLEGGRYVRFRWELNSLDLRKIWDACIVLSLVTGIYAWLTGRVGYGEWAFIQWLPIFFIPLLAAQTYSEGGSFTLQTLFWIFRKRFSIQDTGKILINTHPPYFTLCILSASTANTRDDYFYPLICIFLAATLLALRPRSTSLPKGAAVLLAASLLGWVGHVQLHHLHHYVEAKISEWYSEDADHDTDLFQSRTAIGFIGNIKLSSRIILRVTPENNELPPPLLREAIFNVFRCTYRDARWFAHGIKKYSTQIPPDSSGMNWSLADPISPAHSVHVMAPLHDGAGPIPLPHGIFRLENLPVASLTRTPLGMFQVSGGPDMIRFKATYSPAREADFPIHENDLKVPPEEEKGLEQALAEIPVPPDASPEIKLRLIQHWFAKDFKYSLHQDLAHDVFRNHDAPVTHFLLHGKTGHCEYYATATVLLLRKAGIPARYATGWAVQEPDASGKVYLVRKRHAHAWTLAHINQEWIDVDTTPSTWFAEEEKNLKSPWQSLLDSWDSLLLSLQVPKDLRERLSNPKVLSILLFLTTSWLAWRLFFQKKRLQKSSTTPTSTVTNPAWTGMESEFYEIERMLVSTGCPRDPGEPLTPWLRRISPRIESPDLIREILQLHYRLRFDPAGLSATEREQLRSQVTQWKKNIRNTTAALQQRSMTAHPNPQH